MTLSSVPALHIANLRLTSTKLDGFDYEGPFGRRSFSKARGGAVVGARLNGKVLDLLATDYGNSSADGSIRQHDGYMTVQADDGTVILLQYRGRQSPFYGDGQSRIQILFNVGAGPYAWLNGVQGVGIGRDDGNDTVFDIYELLLDPDPATDNDAGRVELEVDYLFTRQSKHVQGAERHIVASPVGSRFLTLAEGGGTFKGPKISGEFLSGYSWSPHRIGPQDGGQLLQYDVKTLLRTDDGVPVLMSYFGTFAPGNSGKGWLTAVVFEVPRDSPYAWLNQLQCVGIGRRNDIGSEYTVAALK